MFRSQRNSSKCTTHQVSVALSIASAAASHSHSYSYSYSSSSSSSSSYLQSYAQLTSGGIYIKALKSASSVAPEQFWRKMTSLRKAMASPKRDKKSSESLHGCGVHTSRSLAKCLWQPKLTKQCAWRKSRWMKANVWS